MLWLRNTLHVKLSQHCTLTQPELVRRPQPCFTAARSLFPTPSNRQGFSFHPFRVVVRGRTSASSKVRLSLEGFVWEPLRSTNPHLSPCYAMSGQPFPPGGRSFYGHSEDGFYSCSHCGKAYSTSHHLYTHERSACVSARESVSDLLQQTRALWESKKRKRLEAQPREAPPLVSSASGEVNDANHLTFYALKILIGQRTSQILWQPSPFRGRGAAGKRRMITLFRSTLMNWGVLTLYNRGLTRTRLGLEKGKRPPLLKSPW